MELYYANIDVEFLPDSENAGFAGAFAYVFAPADDVRDFLARIEREIEGESFRVRRVEFVAIYEDIPWDTDKDQRHYDQLAREAEDSGSVVWDDLYVYDKDENAS